MTKVEMACIISFVKCLNARNVPVEGFHVRNDDDNWIAIYLKDKYLPEYAKIKESYVEGTMYIEFQGTLYGTCGSSSWQRLCRV